MKPCKTFHLQLENIVLLAYLENMFGIYYLLSTIYCLPLPTGVAAAIFTAVVQAEEDHHHQDADPEVEAEVEEEHYQGRHLTRTPSTHSDWAYLSSREQERYWLISTTNTCSTIMSYN